MDTLFREKRFLFEGCTFSNREHATNSADSVCQKSSIPPIAKHTNPMVSQLCCSKIKFRNFDRLGRLFPCRDTIIVHGFNEDLLLADGQIVEAILGLAIPVLRRRERNRLLGLLKVQTVVCLCKYILLYMYIYIYICILEKYIYTISKIISNVQPEI